MANVESAVSPDDIRCGFDTSSSSSLSLLSSSSATSPDALSDDDSAENSELCNAECLDDGHEYVLVVGGLGYIGSHTTLELLKSGYNVIVVDNLSNSYANVLNQITKLAKAHHAAHCRPMPAIKFHRVDYQSRAMRWVLDLYPSLRHPNSDAGPERSSRIIGVIHFAAYKSVDESLRKPLDYYRNNVCGLVDFLALLHRSGIRNVIFSSSAAVYGSKTKAGKPLKEDDLVHDAIRVDDNVDGAGATLILEAGITGLVSSSGFVPYPWATLTVKP